MSGKKSPKFSSPAQVSSFSFLPDSQVAKAAKKTKKNASADISSYYFSAQLGFFEPGSRPTALTTEFAQPKPCCRRIGIELCTPKCDVGS